MSGDRHRRLTDDAETWQDGLVKSASADVHGHKRIEGCLHVLGSTARNLPFTVILVSGVHLVSDGTVVRSAQPNSVATDNVVDCALENRANM